MLFTYCIAGNWKPITVLAGLVMIPIGSPTALIPLPNLIKASKLFGIAQFTWSVNVVPSQDVCAPGVEENTGLIVDAVPTASANSALVANAYTDVYDVGR